MKIGEVAIDPIHDGVIQLISASALVIALCGLDRAATGTPEDIGME